ncbi:MAG: HipA domain-containing protein [Saprospirales bacterium]|nr:HipA domain-containing protein [Saprospirales bacterium]
MQKFKRYPTYPLYIETPINWSGFSYHWQQLPILRRGYFYKENIEVGGDAPKSFIRVYEYGECRKNKPKTWVAYVAKVGHKWYPIESITEYLMNRIGEEIGLNMAKSKLALAGGQIRFLSRYFLKPDKNEQLIHGAQIYARHLEDEDFVEQANERKRNDITRELFTFQFTEEAIQAIFPDHHEEIMQDFVAMILFDAIVGNNDRHFYNWGLSTMFSMKQRPVFLLFMIRQEAFFGTKTRKRLKPSSFLESS